HITNCLLCHAPATGGRDPVVGLDPFSNRPVNSNDLVGNYGASPAALQQSLGGWTGLLIRADVQFVRQDFSITFPVMPVFGGMPGLRFDFVIRTGPLKAAELQEWKKQPQQKDSFRQRDATLFALRALTGKDAGTATEAWLKLFPNANAE